MLVCKRNKQTSKHIITKILQHSILQYFAGNSLSLILYYLCVVYDCVFVQYVCVVCMYKYRLSGTYGCVLFLNIHDNQQTYPYRIHLTLIYYIRETVHVYIHICTVTIHMDILYTSKGSLISPYFLSKIDKYLHILNNSI